VNRSDHDTFWKLYDRQARGPIDRACRSASRIKTDSTMDPDDMVAWVDSRVWTMLEKDAYPTFHDDPTPQEAVNRLVRHAPTLARWAYMALCRAHFRRLENRSEYLGGMSRAERLSMASSVDTKIEKREQLNAAIDSLRKSLSAGEKQKLAASWIEREDRNRVALVLGATRREDDRMITKVSAEVMNENTVQQMRSRARRRAQQVLDSAKRAPVWLLAAVAAVTVTLGASVAEAGEQTGGRRGMSPHTADATVLCRGGPLVPGEQTGGRGPKP